MYKMLIAIANIEKRKNKNKNAKTKQNTRHVGQKTFPTCISHHEGNVSNCHVKEGILWKDGMVSKIARVKLGYLSVFFPYL